MWGPNEPRASHLITWRSRTDMVGAGVAAYGVILSEHDARALASMKWDFNQELYESLLFQSRCAMWGLIVVALGTFMQIIGIVLQERHKTNLEKNLPAHS
jgi:hypothetical protein